ncbi:hypothetical protein ACQJBY_004785 [Aegilops geniculata]
MSNSSEKVSISSCIESDTNLRASPAAALPEELHCGCRPWAASKNRRAGCRP